MHFTSSEMWVPLRPWRPRCLTSSLMPPPRPCHRSEKPQRAAFAPLLLVLSPGLDPSLKPCSFLLSDHGWECLLRS